MKKIRSILILLSMFFINAVTAQVCPPPPADPCSIISITGLPTSLCISPGSTPPTVTSVIHYPAPLELVGYTWTPFASTSSTPLSPTDMNVFTTFPSAPLPATYCLTANARGPELIVNGDFSLGNNCFVSGYAFFPFPVAPDPDYMPVSNYTVGNNTTWFGAIPIRCDLFEHTTGTGKMLIANGPGTAPAPFVWQQTVPVCANVNYRFSMWCANWTDFMLPPNLPGQQPQIEVFINGFSMGVTPVIGCGLWQQITFIWPSGTATTANVQIRDNSIEQWFNDFAIDDISMRRMSTAQACISLNPMPTAIATPIYPCPANPYFCPGSTASIEICGTPGATVHYSGTLPSLSGSVILPITGCVTVNSFPVPVGTYDFSIDMVDDGRCKSIIRTGIPVEVRYPHCTSLVVDGGVEPCQGGTYQIGINGDPGTYTLVGSLGTFTVTVPASGYGLSPLFTMPGMPVFGGGYVTSMHTFCVTNITDPCGCSMSATESEPLCCLNVYARPTPWIILTHTTACAGSPFTIEALTSPISAPVTSVGWSSTMPGFVGSSTTGPHSLTITPTTVGPFVFTATAVSTPSMCAYTATTTVTVSAPPSITSAPTNVCVGSTTAPFIGSPAGGTWGATIGTWSPHASIDPLSGIATGLSIGTSIITYTMPSGCSDTRLLNVDPLPDPITGDLSICGISGIATTTLSSTSPGGVWNSSIPAVATISATGVVTGVTTGTSLISYTIASGCTITAVVSVDIYAPITGITMICSLGSTSPLSSSDPGGTWSSSNTDVATIGLTTGDVTGVGPGTAIITYHRVASTCNPTVAVTVVLEDMACVEHIVTPPAYGFYRFSSFYEGARIKFTVSDGGTGCFPPPSMSSIITTVGPGVFMTPPLIDPIMIVPGYYAYKFDMPAYEPSPLCVVSIVNMVSYEVSDATGSCSWPSTGCGAGARPANNGNSETDKANTISAVRSLLITPNPNTGTFTLSGQLPCADACTVEIEVTDVLGKTIYSDKVSVDNGKLNTKINLGADFANGIYLVRVKNNDMSEVIRFTLDR